MNKYEVLVRYIRLFLKDHYSMTKEDVNLIINALEGEEILIIEEEKTNE